MGGSPGTARITATAWDGSNKQGNKEITVNTFHRETWLNNYINGNYIVEGFTGKDDCDEEITSGSVGGSSAGRGFGCGGERGGF